MQSIAFDGTNYLIVYRNSDDNYYDAIFGTRVSPTGNVLDPDGKLVCPVSNLPELQDAYPSIAFGNSNYLVVWEHTPCMWYPYCFDIYGTRVAPDLSIFDPQGIVASSDGYDFYEQWDPAAAFDGTKYLIVWEDDRVSPTSDIYGSIITTNPSNPNPYIIVISAASDWQWYPAVVIGDSLYLVVWIDERSGNPDIYGTRIKTNGEVLDPGGIEISSTSEDQENPKVAFDGTNFLVCWDDERTSDNDIYCARIDQQGNVIDGDGILITASNYDQVFPAVCFGGMNYFVVWQDFRGNDDDIYGARITPSGTVLDPNGIVISNAAGDQEDPKVSYDGSNFLVVWDDERSGVDDVYGARVTPAGTILDPNGIPISTANDQQEYASVVFNGTNFLVAWDDFRNNTDTADVYFAEVNTAGSIISENPLVTGYGDQFYTALAHGSGTQTLLVYNDWTEEYSGYNVTEYRVWAKFVGEPNSVEGEVNATPTEFILYQNYPNPFNPITKIKYSVPQLSNVVIKVFDILGNEIETLVNEEKPAGYYAVEFNAATLPSGVYFYQLKVEDFVSTKKMILLK
jgi:hypothetical protein